MKKCLYLFIGLILIGQSYADTTTVTLGKTGGAIDPKIYGVNFLIDPALGTRLVRFGGNGLSRFNPVNGKYNNSDDWDFSNTGELAPDTGKPYSAVRAMGAEPLVQILMLGYIAGDRTWGSVKVDPVRFSSDLVYDLNIKKKAAIKYFGMDNEPDCWMTTHRDMWKHKLGYDEYLDIYLRTAEGMKAVDPTIQLFGPVSANLWFYDHLNRDEDFKEKGAWIPYFLRKCAEHDKKWGKRSLDYLDIHRYPDHGKTDSAALEVSREWWDTTYTKEPIILMMQKWIKDNYPGTKLSISEYGMGARRPMCRLIWIAQNLGTFGRMGVAGACKWGVGEDERLVYGLYGNIFGNSLVDAAMPRQSPIDCFASVNTATKDRIVVLINKDLTAARTVSIVVPGFAAKAQDVYCIAEGADRKPLLTHEPKRPAESVCVCPPLSVSFVRLRSAEAGARGDYIPAVPSKPNPAEEKAKEVGGGYPIDPDSGFFFYHASVIDRDITGFDSFKGSGDTGLNRGGARDQVATDLHENYVATLPDSSLTWFDNSSRITRSKKTDALLFDWHHRNRGWVDARIAHDLKWQPQDLSTFVASKGYLVFYVKPLIDSVDFTVYVENTETPERTLSVLASDYVKGRKFKAGKEWQEVKIPLKALDIEEQGTDYKRIRYIGFGNAPKAGAVKMLVDEIAFVRGK